MVFAYSLIERSDENLPARAELRIDDFVHPACACHAFPTSRWVST